MAWVSPLDPPGTPKAAFIDVCEWVFLAIFTGELLTKMVAYGLIFHAEAYLRDPWCQLDFAVVSLAWLPILLPSWESANVNVVRSVRALRPLRALKRLPGMPALVSSILGVLRDRDYVHMDKNRFIPDDKGRILTAFLTQFFHRYVEYDFTAALEERLDKVSAGELPWKELLRAFWKDFQPFFC